MDRAARRLLQAGSRSVGEDRVELDPLETAPLRKNPSSRITAIPSTSAIFSGHLALRGRPTGSPDRSALSIAGNSEAAKATVTAFLDAIGYDVVDAGPLSEGWQFQKDTPAYGLQYAADPANWGAGAGPAGVDEVDALLAQASRAG